MAPNATGREEIGQEMARALDGAELVGYNDRGFMCVWSGGYSFNVYDPSNDWNEARHFTSGAMVDWSDTGDAAERMEAEGFRVIR